MEHLSFCITRNHLLSRVDGRVKIVVSLTLLAMVLSYRGFLFPLVVTVLAVALCAGMRVPIRTFALRFAEPVFIALVILVLKLFFSGADPLFNIDISGVSLTGYRDGLMEGLLIVSRIIAAVALIAVLGFSTSFTEFMAGLSWLKVPQVFIEVLMFAYRYIFLFIEEASVIYNAQKNRLGYSSVRRGLTSFGILAGSLTLRAFEHSQNTTIAMVQRGYDGNIPIMKHRPFRAAEVLLSLVLVVTMGVVWKI